MSYISISDEQILTCVNDKQIMERFFTKVVKTNDCWEWIGGISKGGYGLFGPKSGYSIRAHRVIFTYVVGRLPEGVARHKCDNRKCVNPFHVTEGTQAQNLQDCLSRGRGRQRFEYDSCLRGHKYVEGSYYINSANGFKQCKRCTYESHGKPYTGV